MTRVLTLVANSLNPQLCVEKYYVKSRYLRHSRQFAASVNVGLPTSGAINLDFIQLHKHSRIVIESYLARAHCGEGLVYLRTGINHSGNGIDPIESIPV